MASNYWKDREADSLNRITNKSIKQIEKQIKKYYRTTMKSVIALFESTYDKLLATIESGRAPTPADLYNLSKYWQMQAQLKKEMQRLNDKQVIAMSKAFETNYFEVYYSLSKESSKHFATLDTSVVQQIINSVWAADGKNFSQRVWGNTEKLIETLNEELVNCVIAGKKTTELKQRLQERFNVSYSQADALVRTESSHIQTKAAEQSYKDAGVEYEQVWASPDERRCKVCGELHKKKFPVGTAPIPAHPNCRCTVLAVIDEDDEDEDDTATNVCDDCGREFTTYNKFVTVCPICKQKRRDKYNRKIK